jgi:hypothetical protein
MVEVEDPAVPSWTVRALGVALVVLGLGASWALLARFTDATRGPPSNVWGLTIAVIVAGLVILVALVLGYRMITVRKPAEFTLPTWMLWFGRYL